MTETGAGPTSRILTSPIEGEIDLENDGVGVLLAALKNGDSTFADPRQSVDSERRTPSGGRPWWGRSGG